MARLRSLARKRRPCSRAVLLRLGVEAEGAAVVGVGSNLRMALEHVQKF